MNLGTRQLTAHFMHALCAAIDRTVPVRLAVRSKVLSIAATAGSNPEGYGYSSFVCGVCCIGRGLCDELITRSKVSYRLCASV